MSNIEIKHRHTGAVLFFCDVPDDVDSGLRVRYALEKATQRRANLAGANLAGANLAVANLAGADLEDADLAGAYIAGANLAGANLAGANLAGAKNADLAIAQTRILPAGSLIGWKKLRNGIVAKLRIPESAKRSHAFGRKCRAEYAEVLELIGGEVGVSMHDEYFEYRAGITVRPHEWSGNWQEECAGGIHFYITQEEAEAHL